MIMAICKICGTEVRTAREIHPRCWEKATAEMAEIFCDQYCRWPHECSNSDDLETGHCDSCHLVRLLNLGL